MKTIYNGQSYNGQSFDHHQKKIKQAVLMSKTKNEKGNNHLEFKPAVLE